MVSIECLLYDEYQDVDPDNELSLATETGEGVGTDNTAGIVGTVVDVWISPMGWNHCIHDDLDTVEAISRRLWNSVTCEF